MFEVVLIATIEAEGRSQKVADIVLQTFNVQSVADATRKDFVIDLQTYPNQQEVFPLHQFIKTIEAWNNEKPVYTVITRQTA